MDDVLDLTWSETDPPHVGSTRKYENDQAVFTVLLVSN